MAFEFRTMLLAAGMLVGMLVFLEIGRWLGGREPAVDHKGGEAGIVGMEGAVFALFGLLIAFTFSGASERFDHRRDLVVEEANAIGTAYLRLDLLPAESQPALRALFRQYLESRLALYNYHEVADLHRAQAELDRATAFQDTIWKRAVEAARITGNPQVVILVATGLNAMFDISTTRVAAMRKHTPLAIFGMLFVLAFASALLAGRSMGESQRRRWLHMLVFACAIAVSVFVILNLEYPRLGFIRMKAADEALVEVLHRMR